jgi:magnesium-transporting ATPase (P-type)
MASAKCRVVKSREQVSIAAHSSPRLSCPYHRTCGRRKFRCYAVEAASERPTSQRDVGLPAPDDSEPFRTLVDRVFDVSVAYNSDVVVDELLAQLGVTRDEGLRADAVEKYRQQYGSNRLPDASQASFLELVLEATEDFTLKVLLASATISLALWWWIDGATGSGWIDGVAILATVTVVVLVTATTNFQRDRQFRQLSAAAKSIDVRYVLGRTQPRPLENRPARAGLCASVRSLETRFLIWTFLDPGL